MSENKKCSACGWDKFEVEIRDAEAETCLRCAKCGQIITIEINKVDPAPSRPAAKAVDAICRDFDADRMALLQKSDSTNPLKFPRP